MHNFMRNNAHRPQEGFDHVVKARRVGGGGGGAGGGGGGVNTIFQFSHIM